MKQYSNSMEAVERFKNWSRIKVKLFLLVAFLAVSIGGYAQTAELEKFEQNGKWGFKDQQGNVVVRATYDAVFDFSDGMARVRNKDKFGFVDATGKEVVKPKYLSAADFENGVAIVAEKKTKWLLATLMATAAAAQSVSDEMYYMTDMYGRRYNRASLSIPDQLQYDINLRALQNKLSDGTSAAGEQIKTGQIVGLIDKTGKQIIPAKYHSLINFKDNLWITSYWNGDQGASGYPFKAIYGHSVTEVKNNLKEKGEKVDNTDEALIKYGIYNAGKGEVIKGKYTKFDTRSLESKGLIVVATSKFKIAWVNYWKHSHGVIDHSGKVVIPLKYDFFDADIFAPHERILTGEILKRTWANIFSPDIYEVERANFGILDHSGKIIIPMIECEGIELIDNAFVATSKTGEKKYFDLDGREINK